MDTTEIEVEKYLKNLGFATVVYEPDGNIPPDFLCDGRVAVEVRRLNQQENSTSGQYRGLGETSVPLVMHLRRMLSSLGPPKADHSWFVFYRFRRPLPKWKNLGVAIKGHLEGFRDSPLHARTSIEICPQLELKIFCASKVFNNQFFVLGGFCDKDSGGWLLAKMEKSLQLCIQDKAQKIFRVRHKYPEWWLALADHIGYGLDNFDRELFNDLVRLDHDWDKIILIDPLGKRQAFEI
jgi:hypothetical protein